ncbi:MAG: HD domain-containing protein [Verrucomicrobia bacterium]|nr:HD domain-containing protein [Verrucomicrobiota bacterium]
MKKHFILLFLLVTYPLLGWYRLHDKVDYMELETLYGATTIREPVLLELIRSPAFERLKKIRQYGVTWFIQDEYEYTRHEHSLGVFYLVRKYGAPLDEQVAALLHDVSHTVFSHVGDYIYGHIQSDRVMQDDMHEDYLAESGLIAILKKHNLAHAVTEEAKKGQRCFEQDKPNICADRLEYVLNGAVIDGIFAEQDIANILQHLHFKKDEWYFDDVAAAKKYASASVALPERRWGAKWHAFTYSCMGKALVKALTASLITFDEIRFSTDDVVWKKVEESKDPEIMHQLRCLKNWRQSFVDAPSKEEADAYIVGKFTGQDPWVMTKDGLQRLSSLDSEFKGYYARVASEQKQGYWIKYVKAQST